MPYTYRRPFFLEEELLSCKENTTKDTIRTDYTQQLEAEQRHVNRHKKSHNPQCALGVFEGWKIIEESKNFGITQRNAKKVFITDGLWTEGWDFFRLYYHIVLCTDLFLTSHEDGNFWKICRLFEVFWDAN